MPNYQNGKIYKIFNYDNDDVYYGSTIETLSRRMSKHRANLKSYKQGKYHYTTSFKILEVPSATIELVEYCPCNTKEELLQREQYYIKNNDCVNKIIPLRTKQEYFEDHKSEIQQ